MSPREPNERLSDQVESMVCLIDSCLIATLLRTVSKLFCDGRKLGLCAVFSCPDKTISSPELWRCSQLLQEIEHFRLGRRKEVAKIVHCGI
jgi:hypothetical protein